jgi:murein DD-endopeptidase MepM/ murein hydrolase activator NlpD
MRSLARSLHGVLAAVVVCGALLAAVPRAALATEIGGTQAPSAPRAGGVEYGVALPAAAIDRPLVRELSLPSSALAGPPPRVLLRVVERGVGTVRVAVIVRSLASGQAVLVARLGWVRTGRRIVVSWPAGATLPAGAYAVGVSVRDHHGLSPSRRPSVAITVRAAPPSAPALAPAPSPSALLPGAPTPAQTVTAGAVFPVAGPYSFGGPGNRFGAAREGHVHEGQDVIVAEGTPVLAPLAGTIAWKSYQAAGAGYYAVEHTTVGLDLMLAHCQAGSLTVSAGTPVTAGEKLCGAGRTGDATAPHLHFEIWVGGWRAPGSQPIDPLPYLEAWAHRGP